MAIAFDTATNGGFASGTSRTFSHTCSGSNRILFVHCGHNASSDIITGVTYNGVSMTQIATVSPTANRREYLFYLIAPATGANNVVITASGSTSIFGNAASYTGVKQSDQPDNSTTATSSTTPSETTLTTVADNCWTILCTVMDSSVEPTASTNSTKRIQNGTFTDAVIFDSNGAVTPAGSFTMTLTHPGTDQLSRIMASFAPATSTANFFQVF